MRQEASTIRALTRQPVDGFILLAAAKYLLPRLSEYLRKSGRPVVEITSAKAEFDHVVHAYNSGTRALMAHLLDLGHRRIGFVYGIAREVQGFDRLLTYREALERAGISADRSLEVHCDETLHEAYRAAHELLNRPERPTALLVINDMLATAVLRAASDLGLSVPGDVSVASFDDIPGANYTIPRLTTVSGKSEESGRDAVRLLLRRFAEPDLPQQVTTPSVELIVRESTGPVNPRVKG